MKATTTAFRRLGEVPQHTVADQAVYANQKQLSRLSERQLSELARQATQVNFESRCSNKNGVAKGKEVSRGEGHYTASDNNDQTNPVLLPQIDKKKKNFADKSQLVASWKKNKFALKIKKSEAEDFELPTLKAVSTASLSRASSHGDGAKTDRGNGPQRISKSNTTVGRLTRREINLLLARTRATSACTTSFGSRPSSAESSGVSPTISRTTSHITDIAPVGKFLDHGDGTSRSRLARRCQRVEGGRAKTDDGIKIGSVSDETSCSSGSSAKSLCGSEATVDEQCRTDGKSVTTIDVNLTALGIESYDYYEEEKAGQGAGKINTTHEEKSGGSDTSGYNSTTVPSDDSDEGYSLELPDKTKTQIPPNPAIPHVIWRDKTFKFPIHFIYGAPSRLAPIIIPAHSVDCPMCKLYTPTRGEVCPPNSPTPELKKDYGFYPVQGCLNAL